MAFDPVLADRIATRMASEPDVTTRRMFGGIAWLCAGHMAVGIVGHDLVLRLGEAGATAALRQRGVRPMDFTGRPLRSMVYVAATATGTARALHGWIDRALAVARAMPPKPEPKRRRRPTTGGRRSAPDHDGRA